MSGYTPTTEHIREYVATGGEPRPWLPPTPAKDEARGTAFDRWITAHDAEVRAQALRDAADEVERIDPQWDSALWISEADDERGGTYWPMPHWLRARADQIEAETKDQGA